MNSFLGFLVQSEAGKKNQELTAEAQRERRDYAEKTIFIKVFSACPLRLCASAVGF
jgi:hypothetical protein